MLTDEEKEKIAKENMYLVGVIARKYSHLADYDEMYSTGEEYLVQGLNKYDPEKGKAGTYLYHWIFAGVMKSLYNNSNVHIPWNIINNYINNRDTVVKPKEFSFDNIFNDKKETGMWIVPHGKDKLELLASLSGTYYGNTEKELENNELKQHIEFTINNSTLTSVEKNVVIHRFGLFGEDEKTLQEIGDEMGYTAMGIQKVEKRALKKLNNNKMITELKE